MSTNPPHSIICMQCSVDKPVSNYSGSQLKKSSPKCKDCIEKSTAPPHVENARSIDKSVNFVPSQSKPNKKIIKPKNFFVVCPHCELMVEVSHFNCGVFRHGN